MVIEEVPATYDYCDPEGHSKCLSDARNQAEQNVSELMEQWQLAGITPDYAGIARIYEDYLGQCDEMQPDTFVYLDESVGECEDGCFKCPNAAPRCDSTVKQTQAFSAFLRQGHWVDATSASGLDRSSSGLQDAFGDTIATLSTRMSCQSETILSLTTTTTTSTTSSTSTTNTTPNTYGG